MNTKSSPVRSCRESLDPYPPPPETLGPREIDPDTVRPHKKRQCPLETVKPDGCIVCDVSDERVSSCSGVDCLLQFHEDCLTPEFGGSEDLSNPFCPYCWLKVVSLESKSLREEAVRAEKAVCKYLDKDTVSGQGLQGDHGECSSKEVHFDKNSHEPEDEGTGMEEDNGIEDEIEASSEDEERVAADNVQDALGDDESAQFQTKVNQGRRVEMNATDSEISSAMEPDGEDVSERGEATHVDARPNTLRNSFFDIHQRRRLLWTPEEEAMLMMGVKRFSAGANKNIPWRKILEMGRNVFHQTRHPTHLKDKWRNMLKAQH